MTGQLRSTSFTATRLLLAGVLISASSSSLTAYEVEENEIQIDIDTPQVSATIRKTGYVSGVAGGTFLDKQTGFRDAGFGLDIADWIMEPGSDRAYRDLLPDEMIYRYENDYHGSHARRSIEGPQICTKARRLDPQVIRGEDFVAVTQEFRYQTAAPGHKAGSLWQQKLVFPAGKRYFVSSDQVTSVNQSDAMFQRLDLPGHIKHKQGDTFSEVYLSYVGRIPAKEFSENFAPDAKFNYRRDSAEKPPKRFIRAYHLRDPKTGQDGPWLAGMTLDPNVVYAAWCHQRGYICMIQEYGGRPIKPGETFSAAFIVGFFDSIEEMQKVYDEHAGNQALQVSTAGWKLLPQPEKQAEK